MTEHDRPQRRPLPVEPAVVADRLDVVAAEYEARAAWFRARAGQWRERAWKVSA